MEMVSYLKPLQEENKHLRADNLRLLENQERLLLRLIQAQKDLEIYRSHVLAWTQSKLYSDASDDSL